MSFRLRLFLAFGIAAIVPLGMLAAGLRGEMSERLTAEYQRRVSALAAIMGDDLAAQSRTVGTRLATISQDLAADSRFRLAAAPDADDRRWLLDYAGDVMRVAGLAMLQVQDRDGRILSSGHFRNEYDRLAPAVPRLLAAAPNGTALVRTRTAAGTLLALVRVDSFEVAGRRYTVVGGLAIDSATVGRLTRDPDLRVRLLAPAAERAAANDSGDVVVGQVAIPFIDAADSSATGGTARLVVTQRLSALAALRRSTDRWFLGASAATVAIGVLLAAGLAARVSQPLRELAHKTAAIDLDRLDQDFATERTDEFGALSNLLGEMTDRIRASTAQLRDVERRAAVGDLARQVNHDIKNGLAPIRHVLRHFAQVARDEPAALPAIFVERQATLDASVEYLETLARNYASLYPRADGATCDANAVARQVVGALPPGQAAVELQLAEHLPLVRGDGIALRRVLENLVGNAVDSLASPTHTITVRTEPTDDAGVRITVADTGRGMTRAELDRAFEDFYTTKPNGTGLGLSVVRRLILDLEGTLRVETEPGTGTRVVVELPDAHRKDRA